jgi:hypothetical protein
MILREHGIYDVEVVPIEGELTDHYDPTNKRLALSESVYGSTSIAAGNCLENLRRCDSLANPRLRGAVMYGATERRRDNDKVVVTP